MGRVVLQVDGRVPFQGASQETLLQAPTSGKTRWWKPASGRRCRRAGPAHEPDTARMPPWGQTMRQVPGHPPWLANVGDARALRRFAEAGISTVVDPAANEP